MLISIVGFMPIIPQFVNYEFEGYAVINELQVLNLLFSFQYAHFSPNVEFSVIFRMNRVTNP